MLGPAVIIAALLLWLSRGRVAFTWRMSWLSALFVVICVASLTAGMKVAGGIAGGLFLGAHSVGVFITHL
jgi:hypothetical protein